MKLFSIILFSLLIFVGKLSMASFIVNPEALNRFKHKINYAAITAKLPQDKLGVYLDWEDTLSHLLIDESSWEVEDIRTSIIAPFHAGTSLEYEKNGAHINLEVNLFSDLNNIEILDEALAMMSNTTMMDIIMEYDKNGPCDVFFYYSSHDESNTISVAICVFRNVIVRIDTLRKGIDVRSVLESLHNTMKASLVNISEVKLSNINCHISAEVVSVDQDFFVELLPPLDKPYIVDLHHNYGDSLEYLHKKNLRFSFKAKQPGVHIISISVLDPKTLVSTNIQKSITVK